MKIRSTVLVSALGALGPLCAFADIPAATPVPQKCVGDSAGWLVRHTNNVAVAKATFGDFLHPNRDGYRIWCDNVLPYFEKYAK